MKISLKAPAKINWFLSVLNKRDDGYHNIVSPMQCVDLFDRLTFEKAEDICLLSDLNIPAEGNLVYRAAALLKKVSSYKFGARIELQKNIPVAAGLGGGSSDAAFTLMGLNRLWGLNFDRKMLMKLAAEIGSDVPFFLAGNFSLIEGRGEKVTELSTEGSLIILLAKPDIAVSTAWAYNSFETGLTKKTVDIKLFCQALDRKNFAFLHDAVFNDLEDVVIRKYPVIGELKETLNRNGAVLSLMSGSGSVVFGVFNTVEEAVRASANLQGRWCRVVRTLNRSDELGMGNEA
ncbi:MAG: 4-(cytidine 5'-diphospho)-2-C-methyl-D-erythritol kinase [Nitrospiraceae bacterium]|jgi:4-diphosphocytidyl-2-C-methyl-D-erythritol kinase|nr:MAG: 4-(cytidine 5'-diphospho)-2-C-methyl-D-erythritol kinase [Nitrospiraceae bacterium]